MAIQQKSGQPKQPGKQSEPETAAKPGKAYRGGSRQTSQTNQDQADAPTSLPEQGYPSDQRSTPILETSHNRQRRQRRLMRQKRDRTFEKSYKQILQAAAEDQKWAIIELAAYAEYQRDYRRAIKQYERIAVQGDLYYMRRIAVLYEQSLEDIDSAIDWYAEAGHYGDTYSMIRAGNLLELHVEDYDEAVSWYRKAAQLESLSGIYHLCRIYEHKLHDFESTVEWYKRAVQLGDMKAAISLGQLYENSGRDYAKAVEWYSVAASHKSLYAINLLCRLYETRLRDYPCAIEWYKRAIALYNEQNGAEVVAADAQAQQSLNAIIPATAPIASPYTPQTTPSASVSSTPLAAATIRSSGARMQGEGHDNSLLLPPGDLTPAEIASPGLHNEAEVEFLG